MGDRGLNAGNLQQEPQVNQLRITFNQDQLQIGSRPRGTDSHVYLDNDFIRYLTENNQERLPKYIFDLYKDWISTFVSFLMLRPTQGVSNEKSLNQLRRTAETGRMIKSLQMTFDANFGEDPLQKEQAVIANDLIRGILKSCGEQCMQVLISSREALKGAFEQYDPQKRAIEYATDSWIKMCGGIGSKNNLDAIFQIQDQSGDIFNLSTALFRRTWKIAQDRAQVAMLNRDKQITENRIARESRSRLRNAAQEAVDTESPDDVLKQMRDLIKKLDHRLSIVESKATKASGNKETKPPKNDKATAKQGRQQQTGQSHKARAMSPHPTKNRQTRPTRTPPTSPTRQQGGGTRRGRARDRQERSVSPRQSSRSPSQRSLSRASSGTEQSSQSPAPSRARSKNRPPRQTHGRPSKSPKRKERDSSPDDAPRGQSAGNSSRRGGNYIAGRGAHGGQHGGRREGGPPPSTRPRSQ